jgi:small subunit ribosomal protein S1
VDQDKGMAFSAEGAEASRLSDHPMYELLEQEGTRIVPERGETIEGIIMGISPSEIVVDIACKSEGIVTSRDLERLDPEFRRSLKVGDQVLVYVLRPEDAQGNIILSLSRAQMEGDWQLATELFESGEVVEETISGCNRGGVIAHIGRVRGFIPASQLVSVRIPRNLDDDAREGMLSQAVGQKLALKIIELDRRRNRLILSERAAQREWRQDQKERLLDELGEGETRHGVVSSLCNFGAFVDLGGADGLVHLSELAWRRVEHPSEVLRVGQEVDVQIIGVDRDRRRIALSIKRLQPEPWSTVEERYQIGQLVTGKITKITDFGAFAQIDEDIEGLIHISEISDDRIAHPKDVLQEGQEQTMRIIRIDADRQRMGLSLRRVDDNEYFEDSEWKEDN